MSEHPNLDQDLKQLEIALRKLENEYTMYFAGQLPKPPVGERNRVERLIRRYDRAYIQSYADRFRLSTLQARFNKFVELWDRGLRAREEGRPGPFFRGPRPQESQQDAQVVAPAEQVVRLAAGADPASQDSKIEELYRSVVEARKSLGNEDAFPFDRFAAVVRSQVARLQKSGSTDVAFRVAVKDGKVAFSAQGLKRAGSRGSGEE